MSAKHDPKSRIAYLFPTPTNRIIKAGEIQAGLTTVRKYEPVEIIRKRVEMARRLEVVETKGESRNRTIVDPDAELQENIKTLGELQLRLSFMLQELESLMRDDEKKDQ